MAMPGSNALLVVDMLVGFCRPGGALFLAQDTARVEEYILELANGFLSRAEHVAFCSDAHEETDPEFKQFPPHCMHGSPESAVVPTLLGVADASEWVPKRSFSALRGTRLPTLLTEWNVERVHVTGVATDICVLFTCQDLRAEGLQVSVHRRGVLASHPDRQEFFLKYMSRVLGVEVVDSHERPPLTPD
jgi:nicotinamidase-related amidase